jgi:hypothetical protein
LKQVNAKEVVLKAFDKKTNTISYPGKRVVGIARRWIAAEMAIANEAAGFTFRTYQESRRETWRFGEVEIVIDEWPWMPPYIEIEGSNEGAVKSAAEKLGYNWGDAVFGGTDVIYQRLYNMSDGIRGVIDISDVRFGAPLPKDFTRK